jgi:hypothetical protein
MKNLQNKLPKTGALCLALVVLGGCTAVQPRSAMVPMPHAQQPAPLTVQQQPYAAQTAYGHMQPQQTVQPNIALHNQAVAEIDSLRDRLRRAERAMIRLDRRMQLIEKSELNRMVDLSQPDPAMGTRQNGYQQAAVPAQMHGQLTPMSFQPTQIGLPNAVQGRSIVGAINQHNPSINKVVNTQQSPAALAILPSLADVEKEVEDSPGLTVWSVSYAQGKVWPNRTELLNSADVVKALRSGKSMALFARGKNPTDRQFRDRVRALSQYLGRVADMDSVPISTLASDGLDGNTIELFATR